MPDLNLRDDEGFSDERGGTPSRPGRSKFHSSGGGGGSNKILLVAILVLIALGVVMLNQFGVIHLWGSGTQVVVDLPPLDDEEIQPIPQPGDPMLTPAPEEAETAEPPAGAASPQPTREQPVREQQVREQPVREQPREARPAGTGRFTVQVSAWRDRQTAETQAQRIREAGKDVYIDQTTIDGTTWYRVRIGRFATEEEAVEEARRYQLLLETGWWVARIDN
jgi:cell division protein FtsN